MNGPDTNQSAIEHSLAAALDARGAATTPATTALVCFKKSFLCTPPSPDEETPVRRADMVKALAVDVHSRRRDAKER